MFLSQFYDTIQHIMTYHEFPKDYFGRVNSNEIKMTKEHLLKNLSKYKKHLVLFIESMPQNAIVLDAGCGSGKTINMIKILRPDIRIYASDFADLSEYMINDVIFKKGSVEEIHELFGKEMFDGIICQHVVEHLQYPMAMISSFYASLKRCGKVFIETPNWTRLFTPFSHFYFWNDYSHVRPYTAFAFRKLFYEYKFAEEKILTVSSCEWFVKKNESENGPSTGNANKLASQNKTLLSKIIARIINPFTKDVLIGIAVKK
jgi:2-polyprenyl-3-methyl-5-hydroxy-6-metoxy-1,4-benzoquinol methylase